MDLNEEAYLKTVCPFVKDTPSNNCYVVKTDSRSMADVMKYCAKNYSGCEIYKEHSSKLLH